MAKLVLVLCLLVVGCERPDGAVSIRDVWKECEAEHGHCSVTVIPDAWPYDEWVKEQSGGKETVERGKVY